MKRRALPGWRAPVPATPRMATAPARELIAAWRARHEASQQSGELPEHVSRPERRGDRILLVVLPLDLCGTTNRTRHAPGWLLGKCKAQIAVWYVAQAQRRPEPLSGRPQVLCTRYSAHEPDAYADWAKAAVDKLGPNGLRVIADDRPRAIELAQWWEPAKRGQGFVAIEVWSELTHSLRGDRAIQPGL